MRTFYDVIIAGAGPGGLACANELSNSSLKVLLIEKNAIIGPKTCAGGLTHLVDSTIIPEGKTRSFKKQRVVVNNTPHEVMLSFPIKTIERYELGQQQLRQVQEAPNITILKETVLQSIGEDTIITNRGSFSFTYLVGADGATSRVRKHLGLLSEVCVGLYYDVERVDDDYITWVLNPKLFRTGYIWWFPHQKFTNVGIYFNPLLVQSNQAKEILEEYIADKGYTYKKETFRCAPVNCLYKGCVFDNIFLVGDAAGLTKKMTGEGISGAIISGQEVARKIMNSSYITTELQQFLAMKQKQETVLSYLDKIPFLQSIIFTVGASFLRKGLLHSFVEK